MTSLALRLDKHSVSTSLGAVATLRRVADEQGVPVAHDRGEELIVPANAGGESRRVDVTPGRYLIEATLPSGEIINEEVMVAKDQDVPVTLRAQEHSLHEWLGWQHLVGNVEGNATLDQIFSPSQSTSSKILNTVDASIPEGADLQTYITPLAVQAPTVNLCEKQADLRGVAAWTRLFLPDRTIPRACSPGNEDTSAAIWLYKFNGGQLPERQFAYVDWLGECFVISLPVPWLALETYQDTLVQVMVRRSPIQRNVQIGVVVEDRQFGSIAGLMTASTLPKAAIAVKQARDLLFGKLANPLSAAAGGFVLLTVGQYDPNWTTWIRNLANWFPKIPDGAVLKASMLLRFPESERSPTEARDSLLEAFDRGIPYYSAGVSLLLDGLTTFADDPDVKPVLPLVQRVARRLDLSQAFTVVRITARSRQ